jgi:adenylate kinase
MRLVVTGVPGVGKSTCMKAASEAKNLKIVNFGDFMFEAAKEMGVKDRDQMRKMPVEKQREMQKKAAEKLGKMDDIIVDTHATIKTPRGFMPGLPAWVIQKLDPTTIFLIEASPKEIYNRRNKDQTRARDPDSEDEIRLHQEFNRMAAMSYAALCGATVKVITNADGKVEQAVKEVLAAL